VSRAWFDRRIREKRINDYAPRTIFDTQYRSPTHTKRTPPDNSRYRARITRSRPRHERHYYYYYYYYTRIAGVAARRSYPYYTRPSKLIKSTEPFITRYYNTPLITRLPAAVLHIYIYMYTDDYRGVSVWPREITQATASFPPGIRKTQVTFGYIANPIWTLYPRRNLITGAPEKWN